MGDEVALTLVVSMEVRRMRLHSTTVNAQCASQTRTLKGFFWCQVSNAVLLMVAESNHALTTYLE